MNLADAIIARAEELFESELESGVVTLAEAVDMSLSMYPPTEYEVVDPETK